MPDITPDCIGLLADSHGRNDLLERALAALAGAGTLVHLGDIGDTLRPAALAAALPLLAAHGVQAVLGNNEYSLLVDSNGDNLAPAAADFIRSLPYTLRLGELWFTHSTPFDWPAATRRPVEEYLAHLARQDEIPFRVLFRGHSHQAALIQIQGHENRAFTQSELAPGETIRLDPARPAIVTVGALEEGMCALFDPRRHELRLLDVR